MIQLDKEDVERIVESVLENLSIEISGGGFTNPNSRIVKLKYHHQTLSQTSFDVVQTREYEG